MGGVAASRGENGERKELDTVGTKNDISFIMSCNFVCVTDKKGVGERAEKQPIFYPTQISCHSSVIHC